MRDYIFRGKNESGEWVYGSLVCAQGFCCIMQEDDGTDYNYPYLDDELGCIDGYITPVNPYTVGLFTGFFDYNGNRIFEGDILDRRVPKKYWSNRMYVKWCRGSFELWDFDENEDFLSNWCNEAYRNGKDVGGCYIIGNMIDNVNLMKGDSND